MQAAATDLVMGAYFGARRGPPELRLRPWASLPRLAPAVGPALVTPLRIGMGAGVGAVFAAMAGHTGFWIPAGMAMGLALNALRGGTQRPIGPGRTDNSGQPPRGR
jgi:hypothetical protein